MRNTIDHCIDEYSSADDVEIGYNEGWEPANESSKILIGYHTSASGILTGNIEKYSTFASHIQQGRSWIWDAEALYFVCTQRECV